MPKPMAVFSRSTAEECEVRFPSVKYVLLDDAERYARELAEEKTQELREFYQAQRSLDARFAEKFAANPGVVTRAQFDDLRSCFDGVWRGDYTIKHVSDLRAEISKLDTRVKELEKAPQDVTCPEDPTEPRRDSLEDRIHVLEAQVREIIRMTRARGIL